MTRLSLDLPTSIVERLKSQSGRSLDSLVTEAVSTLLDIPLHTFFQVSTSRSLAVGRYEGAITCARLLEHGDFGVGTFAGLAGEMVIVDGHVFRVEGSGRISEALPSDQAPFATVTRFQPSVDTMLEPLSTYDDLKARLDHFRRSDNLFHAIRIDGVFSYVKTRAVSAPEPGATLLDAAKVQHGFEFHHGKEH